MDEELLGDVFGPAFVDMVRFGGVAEVGAVQHVLEDADAVGVVVRVNHVVAEAARAGRRRDLPCLHHRFEISCLGEQELRTRRFACFRACALARARVPVCVCLCVCVCLTVRFIFS